MILAYTGDMSSSQTPSSPPDGHIPCAEVSHAGRRERVAEALRHEIMSSLAELNIAREREAAYPSGCAPIIEGTTHCKSCGFSYGTYRHIVTHRDRCATPEMHPDIANKRRWPR